MNYLIVLRFYNLLKNYYQIIISMLWIGGEYFISEIKRMSKNDNVVSLITLCKKYISKELRESLEFYL